MGMSIRLEGLHPGRAAVAGMVAAVAYAGEMYVDMAVTGSRFDDIQLVESALHGRMGHPPSTGIAIHLLNGVALGEIYGIIAPHLPGPAWARGLLFGHLFLLAVWPLVPLVDRYHPLIRAGGMPRLARRVAFLQNVARHTTFGLALGLIYGSR